MPAYGYVYVSACPSASHLNGQMSILSFIRLPTVIFYYHALMRIILVYPYLYMVKLRIILRSHLIVYDRLTKARLTEVHVERYYYIDNSFSSLSIFHNSKGNTYD